VAARIPYRGTVGDTEQREATAARQELIEQQGEDADARKVLRICPDHEDQPVDTCEGCYGEGTNEDEEAGE
jgi:hypothetical protein